MQMSQSLKIKSGIGGNVAMHGNQGDAR